MSSNSKSFVLKMSCDNDDDDFQIPLTQAICTPRNSGASKKPLKSSNFTTRPPKKAKRSIPVFFGKENLLSLPPQAPQEHKFSLTSSQFLSNQSSKSKPILEERANFRGFDVEECSLDSIPSSFDCPSIVVPEGTVDKGKVNSSVSFNEKGLLKKNEAYYCNSIESKLMAAHLDCGVDVGSEDSEGELDELLKMCSALDKEDELSDKCLVHCPICGVDISSLNDQERQFHINDCLDKDEGQAQAQNVSLPQEENGAQVSGQVVDASPIVDWLRCLGLEKYGDVFVREEIDWNTLQWLTEEDLFRIGITVLGPRKKIVHALSQLRNGNSLATETKIGEHARSAPRRTNPHRVDVQSDLIEVRVEDASKTASNKLITDYFPGSSVAKKKVSTPSTEQNMVVKKRQHQGSKSAVVKNNGRLRDPPSWCCIPGTPFRVDAFRYLRGDCSHWFLTHFHMDHYQGLTRSFCRGKVYCSSITAKLVNMKIGIPWDRLEVLPINQKISIFGIDVTCLDANHCPGAVILLFEPPNGKAVLHTGDFRYREDAEIVSVLHARAIHTLILDTTYCNPQYDFPKKDAVIQFVIDAIQAEAFNPKTLFLIGSYTIGKEQLFMEVARVLQKKVYVNAAKLRVLKCVGFPEEDMQWFTLNEQESHIHVVPMWTLSSFKRLKHISNQYTGRFKLIVAFSPTGWSFGKGKQKSLGRKWQQGTIIRYEVPYSEHCSFTELKDFVKLVSPVNIIPSVNNHGPDSANSMVSLLLS